MCVRACVGVCMCVRACGRVCARLVRVCACMCVCEHTLHYHTHTLHYIRSTNSLGSSLHFGLLPRPYLSLTLSLSVCVCMCELCVCVYACMHAYTYIHIHMIRTRTYIYTQIHTHTHTHTHTQDEIRELFTAFGPVTKIKFISNTREGAPQTDRKMCLVELPSTQVYIHICISNIYIYKYTYIQ